MNKFKIGDIIRVIGDGSIRIISDINGNKIYLENSHVVCFVYEDEIDLVENITKVKLLKDHSTGKSTPIANSITLIDGFYYDDKYFESKQSLIKYIKEFNLAEKFVDLLKKAKHPDLYSSFTYFSDNPNARSEMLDILQKMGNINEE